MNRRFPLKIWWLLDLVPSAVLILIGLAVLIAGTALFTRVVIRAKAPRQPAAQKVWRKVTRTRFNSSVSLLAAGVALVVCIVTIPFAEEQILRVLLVDPDFAGAIRRRYGISEPMTNGIVMIAWLSASFIIARTVYHAMR